MKENTCNTTSFDYIELYWIMDFEPAWNDEDMSQDIYVLSDQVGVSGIGPSVEYLGYSCDKYGLDFLELSDFIDVEIRLNYNVELYTPGYRVPVTINGEKTGILMNYNDPLLSAQKPFTVMDIFAGLIWELTFYGTPEDRRAKRETFYKE